MDGTAGVIHPLDLYVQTTPCFKIYFILWTLCAVIHQLKLYTLFHCLGWVCKCYVDRHVITINLNDFGCNGKDVKFCLHTCHVMIGRQAERETERWWGGGVGGI